MGKIKVLSKENVIYSFNHNNKPVYFVEDGETFWVETDDCYNGQIKTKEDHSNDVDISIVNAAVGPISITNATPSDCLCVEILDIQLEKQGFMVTYKGLGVLGDKIDIPYTKIIKVENGFAYFSESIKLPLNPMIGVMGVTPKEGNFHCVVPGDFGGNIDTKELKVGTKVYLPIFTDGAGLAIADLHACMGDGELGGTGIEIAGKVLLKVNVIKGRKIARPILELSNSIFTIATEKSFESAMKIAVADMVSIFQEKLKLDFQNAYMLLSATCDIRISQVVNGVITVKVKAPKYLLEGENIL